MGKMIVPKFNNWDTVPLQKVIDSIQPGFASGIKDVSDGIKHLRMNNISSNGMLNLDLVRTVPISLMKEKYELMNGDVLVCTTNSANLVGKSAVFSFEGQYAFSNHLTRIRPKQQIIEPHWLQLQIWLYWIRGGFINNCKHWVNQSTLPRESLLELPIAVPPIEEQVRIMKKIGQAIASVHSTQERLDKVPGIIKRFRQSVLMKACSGRLTEDWRQANIFEESSIIVERFKQNRLNNSKSVSQKQQVINVYSYLEESLFGLPDEWSFVALDKLCIGFQYGTSTKSDPEGLVPVLRMGNLQNGAIDWAALVYTSDNNEIDKYGLKAGDVLFNRTNSPELVGKTSIYRGERPAIFAGYLIKILNSGILDSEYLNFCLNTLYARKYCNNVKTDGVSQSNINAQKLAKFAIPFCSLPEQQEIVNRVQSLFKFADKMEQRYLKAKEHTDKLTQSILAKAFIGEL